MSDILILTEELYIGRGTNKRVYKHPSDSSLCIKINCYDNNGHGSKELKRELRYHCLIGNDLKLTEVIARYHGESKTNMGCGYIYDLIKDYDGETSQTLGDYLLDPLFVVDNFEEIGRELRLLKEELIKHKIVIMGIVPSNILRQKLSAKIARLILVDNLGSGSLIPLEYYIDYFACKRIERRWKRFEDDIKKNFKNLF